jgi:hypothetical protein
MKEAGQDTKEAYNRTLEKQELIKMKPALKAGFVFTCPTSTNVTAGQAAIFIFLKKNIKDLRFHPSFCPF